MRIVNGKLIVDNEDYHVEVNTVHVHEIGSYYAFRILTENGQLFVAAVGKDEPPSVQAAVGLYLKMRAERAPHLVGVKAPTAVEVPSLQIPEGHKVIVDTRAMRLVQP